MRTVNLFNKLVMTLLASILSTGIVSALELNTKMGKPTQEEMNMTQYDADPEAEAVVLYTESVVKYDFNAAAGEFRLLYFNRVRIKVLKPEGTEAGNVSIPYYDPEETNTNEESISGVKVSTYNLENGKVVRSKMSHDLETTERIDKYNCQYKFAAPNVKVGSVIEYEYTLTSDYFFSPNTWYAQCEYPVFNAKYSITVPEWFTFQCFPGGICDLRYKEEQDVFVVTMGADAIRASAKTHIFTGTQLPALKESDGVFCVNDYSTRVEHELRAIQMPGSFYRSYNNSWTNIAYSLYKDGEFGARFKMDNPLAAQQKALVDNHELTDDMSIEERVERLRQLLLDNYKWNGSYSIWGASARQIRKDKDHELNLGSMDFTMMAMLRDAGINAYPVVMSRRSKGRLPMYPSSRYFNCMALRVETSDSTAIYFDPTADGYPVGVLPPDMLVNQGIAIKTDRAITLNLSRTSEGKQVTMVKATIGADGTLKGTAELVYRNQEAGALRQAYRAAKDSAEFAQRRTTRDEMEITDYRLEAIDTNATDAKEYISFEQALQVAGDQIYINPFLFVDLQSRLTAESRMLPIEWPYAYSQQNSVILTLPEGYVVESMPKNKKLEYEDGNYCRTKITNAGGTIRIAVNYTRNALLLLPEKYNDMRDYLGAVEAVTQEMIVLKKQQP